MTKALYLHGSREEELTYSITSQMVQLAIALKLNKLQAIQEMAGTDEEIQSLQIIFWVIYSIEKPVMMRLSRYSVSEIVLYD